MALADGAEVLISIDDDNFCLPETDFVGEHLAALNGASPCRQLLSSESGWMNIMTLLESNPDVPTWPRGFPYYARSEAKCTSQSAPTDIRVGLHAGLWVGDPDVDAVSRVAFQPAVYGHRVSAAALLAGDTWSPINTQNTSLTRKSAVAYYYVRMGYPFGELRLDRFGDILSGYFCQACVKAAGEHVSIGGPIVDHRRTKHDLLKDLGFEYFGILLMEEVLPWLIALRISGTTHAERYLALAEELHSFASSHQGPRWRPAMSAFLVDTAAAMRTWVAGVEQL